MSTFAELLQQVQAKYESDISRLLARCNTFEDHGDLLPSLTIDITEHPKPKRPSLTSHASQESQVGSCESPRILTGKSRKMTANKSAVPWASVMPALETPQSLKQSCCDVDRCLTACYVRFLDWWLNAVEPIRSGWLYEIVESRPFRAMTWLAIVINTAAITLMTDWAIQHAGQGDSNMPRAYIAVDLGCLVWYIIELLCTLLVHRWYFFVNESAGWNILHLALVIFSILELVDYQSADESGTVMYMRSLRFCRVTKAFRIFRVMSTFSELASMLRSFTACLYAMLWSFVLLYLLLFLSALVFAQGISDSLSAGAFPGQEEVVQSHFGTVGRTMLALYMSVTGGADWREYFLLLERTGWVYPWLWLLVIFLFTFALVNILTALFVEKAVEGAKPEREYRILHERKKLVEQAAELRELFFKIDLDHSGAISFDEFMKCMMDDNIVTFMRSIGIEETDAELLWRLVAGEDGELEISHFVDTCMAVKGQASTLDIQKQLLSIERVAEMLRRWELSFWPVVVGNAVPNQGDEGQMAHLGATHLKL